MLDNVRVMPQIWAEPAERAVLGRLRTPAAKLGEHERARIAQIMRQAVEHCCCRACYGVTAINFDCNVITLADGTQWRSQGLADNLAGAGSVVMFAVTAGSAVIEAAAREMAESESLRGAVFDAVGSEAVEQAADELEAHLRAEFARRGMVLSDRRFSPGYGDWSLSAQQDFFRLLPLEASLGLRLSKELMITPPKTITAVIGVRSRV